VTASHVALLTKLNIQPFFFGFRVSDIYEDGTTYASSILDMTSETLVAKFLGGVSKVAALSLAIGYPTQASLPHLVANAYKKLISIALEAEIDIPQVKALKEKAAAAPAATTAAAKSDAKPDPKAAAAAAAAEKAAAATAAKEEEEDAGMGFSLFD